ncbi:conserved hypothetical protein [Rubrivivax sp. A210]|uniref:hypothetical protein n=1 Tax=Rubrivivax sp. A210 TaxID=2772301 RepID=UPI00191998DA|nr:hypothetical protein [Rubrivivax sp. A210]CAD5374297.1 conserved hypothetical protein [Rubrivivax sp. A210]
MHKRQSLEIAVATSRQPTPEQKRFTTLLAKMDKARARLQAWQAQAPVYAQMHAQRVQPELARLGAARRAWALELEQLLLQRRWSRTERQTLTAMICDLCGALLDAAEAPDEEIKALYNRCAEVDFDTEGQQQLEAMKQALEEMGGFDLGDEAPASVDELMERARAQMAERQQDEQAAAQAARPRKGSRTAAKSAASRRAEEDAARISQTVREVYRKLAAALHPDRAAVDATEAQRGERHDLMARANAAYAAGDLLSLLSLQLQIEQVDMAHAAGVAAEQLRHFNKVLAEQLRELEAEIEGREHAFCAAYGLMPDRRLDPERLRPLLQDELRMLALAELQLEHERRCLRGEPPNARRYLKQVRAEQRADELDFPFF